MAIGARILSNNLSGQTATVTFLPATGGTINLGTQTIPFNNLTSYPYGVYQIYVPTYNYTYELTINPPVNVDSFTFVSKLITNNNRAADTLNFNDLNYQILDLNVDATGWSINDVYPLTNSGYAYYFYNNDTCDLQWVLFVDSTGSIVESYQTDCNCDYEYDNLSGKWVTFADYGNGVLKYFNGTDVYTYTVDPTNYNAYVETGWDGVMSNNNFVMAIEDSSGQTVSLYIVDGPTITPFADPIDGTTYNRNIGTYFDGNFIYVILYNYIVDRYESLKIYDGTTGNLLQDVDLSSGDIYNSYNNSFYGNNKCYFIFYNYADSSVDYLIIQYNGNTDVLNTTTHDKVNYPNFSQNSRSNLYPNNGGSDAFDILFFYDNSYNDIGVVVSYADIVYMLSGDTSIQTYTFQNSGNPDKTIRTYASISNNIFIPCDDGDGYVSILSITNSGVTINSTGLLMSNNPSVSDLAEVGNNFVASFADDFYYTGITLVYILSDGSLGDLVTGITLTGAYQRQSSYVGDVFQIRNYVDLPYYITTGSTTFQRGGFTGNTSMVNTYYPTDKFRPDFKRLGLLLNYRSSGFECEILSSSGLSIGFELPANNGSKEFQLGDTTFLYVYHPESGTSLTTINVYDYDFNLITSAQTEFTSWWTTEGCGDNFTVIVNENNRYYIYLVKGDTITQSSISDYDSYYTFNDYVWWD